MNDTLIDLLSGLSDARNRADAARRLAAHLGVEDVLLFVQDPLLHVLVPAAGMRQTHHGGRAWRTYLAHCAEPGSHQAEVDLPTGALRTALTWSTAGMAMVLLGGALHAERAAMVRPWLPLLDAVLSAEQKIVLSTAEAADARDAALRAEALAKALEHARAEAARLNAELREEERNKDEFLAMLAHELRNPLAPIVTAIEILRQQKVDAAAQARLVDLMTRQVGQLSRLIEDLMDVSRVSRGRIELRLETISVGKALEAAIEASRQALDTKAHDVRLHMADTGLVVQGDLVRLTQVFANLIHNAAKYTDPGGRITIAATRAHGHVQVSVADTGIGIAADMLPRIFDLFTQVPVSIDRSQGGLGIGLTLVRKLVDLHGGRVQASSPGSGQGSTFTVTLPLAPPR